MLRGILIIICWGQALSESHFYSFTQMYKKNYDQKQFSIREECFNQHTKNAKTINNTNITYKTSQNQFWDNCADQQNTMYKSVIPQRFETTDNKGPTLQQIQPINYTINWLSEKKVTAVRNQGNKLYSAWVFAQISMIESFYLRKYGKIVDLSELQLYHCSQKYENGKGTILDAFNRGQDYGYALEGQYSYNTPQQINSSAMCKDYRKFNIQVSLQEYEDQSDLQMIEFLREGPFIALVNAQNWIYYGSGTFAGNSSLPKQAHAILIVGVTDQYWLVKNSWGIGWGEKGYMKISRNRTVNCGIGQEIYVASLQESFTSGIWKGILGFFGLSSVYYSSQTS